MVQNTAPMVASAFWTALFSLIATKSRDLQSNESEERWRRSTYGEYGRLCRLLMEIVND